MANRSNRRDPLTRAEARRRARHQAQGRDLEQGDLEEDGDVPGPVSGAARGGLLSRLFPPVPELPGKPNPLEGFNYDGPLPGVVAGLYLLARSPAAWIVPGAIWGVSELIFRLSLPNQVVATIASLVAFGALIGAGWVGWQRPWAFGLAAAVLGVLLYAGIRGTAAVMAGAPGAGTAYIVFASQVALQLVFGVVGGWYGGYLRRRLAANRPASHRGVRRR